MPSEPCSSSGLIPEQRLAPILFNSPRGIASGTSVATHVLMGIKKPTNNKGITLAFSAWVWTGIRYNLCFFPCYPFMSVCLINDYASLFPMRTSFFCSILLILLTTHFMSFGGLLITLTLFDAFVLYCYRVLGPVDTTSWPLFTDEYKSCSR